ncbi:hypothetical protein HanRHA438_Chr10g0468071 [Helianthus annuus]|nr:hypothetical protein HanRHA438_Chr10g0468071 [Helianthus annuus]
MTRLNFQSYGTVIIGEPMGIRVLSGVHFFRSLSLFASAVQRRYRSSYASSDISGCDRLVSEL